jgi:hypothetical protein
MSTQAAEFGRQQSVDARARHLDLLVAVTRIVEQQRPTIDDLLAAVMLPWAEAGAQV